MAQRPEDNDWEVEDWQDIIMSVKYGICTPFLGAGACVPTLPTGSQIAQEWAVKFKYPLKDCIELPRVAQYVAVKRRPMRAKLEIKERLENIKPPDFRDPGEPHGVLAKLPLPVYITTNYDDFMLRALESYNKTPQQEFCRWNNELRERASIFQEVSSFSPADRCPVVFHLHGHIKEPDSLVLTEDDYLDFLVSISKDQNLIPSRIRAAFRGTSLLFLGYQLTDWDFRVLFHSLVGYLDRSAKKVHVSVQLMPVSHDISDAERANIRDYLNSYFGEHNIKVYWGTCRDFVTRLWKEWEGSSYAG